MSRRTASILIGAAAALHAWPAARRLLAGPRETPAFVFPSGPADEEPPVGGASPHWSEAFVSPAAPKVHVGSICELPDGTLASAWYAGSAEGAADVCVYVATRGAESGSAWGDARRVVSRWSAARELSRYVHKVGNSVVFTDQEGLLRLVYVSGSIGGWYSSSLNVKTSSDGGLTWSRSRRLTLNPFCNMSELVKNKPLMLEGGGFVLPVYHEFMGKFPEMAWCRGRPGDGTSWRKSRLAGWRSFFQHAVVPLGPRAALALFRCKAPERAVAFAMTSDGGVTWTRPRLMALPNPDSGLDALHLSDGSVLLAFNDHESERENLRLAVCDYDGRTGSLTATRAATLEEEVGKRFSYPYLIRTRDGLIHIVYRWHGEEGKRIKHVEFNEAWLRERLAERPPGEARR